MATSRENKTISQFKSALIGGGARPNLFEVELTTLPAGIDWDADNFRYMCKAAALPAQNIASIDIPFRGRTFKVAGDRTFDTWTITVINDEDFQYRRAFEAWMQNIGQYSDHSGLTNPNDYMTDATVVQLGRAVVGRETGTGTGGNANILAQYKFKDIFPTNVSAIDLSYDTTDTIEEFTVEFQINFWYPEAPGSNNAEG